MLSTSALFVVPYGVPLVIVSCVDKLSRVLWSNAGSSRFSRVGRWKKIPPFPLDRYSSLRFYLHLSNKFFALSQSFLPPTFAETIVPTLGCFVVLRHFCRAPCTLLLLRIAECSPINIYISSAHRNVIVVGKTARKERGVGDTG